MSSAIIKSFERRYAHLAEANLLGDKITVERLEIARDVSAYLIVRHGDHLTPMFERLERELAALRSQQDATESTKRLLENLGLPMQPKLLDAGQT
jgi:hypothetical protein